MTPDEIINALRGYAENAQENFEVDTMRDFDSAADMIESMQAQLAASQHREQAAVEELQILHEWLGGELPKRCDECELWGKGGWSQYGIGYCEGDYHPHKGTDFCNRWRGPQEAGEGRTNNE